MSPTRRIRLRLAAVIVGAAVVVLPACAADVRTVASATPADVSTQRPTRTPPTADHPRVPGYDTGQFPPVPLLTVPDLAVLDDALGGFAVDLSAELADRPGIVVRPAGCGDAVERSAGAGSMLLYGDGSGSYTGTDGERDNYGDGSGSYEIDGVTVNVYGDGSGDYLGPRAEIHNYGDGSGSYESDGLDIQVYGDGSGSRLDTAANVELHNYGDGSATYRDDVVEIHNYGDGSGSYASGSLDIDNYGDGTGSINGGRIDVEPLNPVAPIGVFPPLGVLAPLPSCGTTITLEDAVLFDFDQSVIRPDAAAVLDELAATLRDLGVPAAEIGGHTDAIGTDGDNQVLSERRAQAVADALDARDVAADLSAVGYGESAPVAPNEIDGRDDPAGRQLNRRVEIIIPAF